MQEVEVKASARAAGKHPDAGASRTPRQVPRRELGWRSGAARSRTSTPPPLEAALPRCSRRCWPTGGEHRSRTAGWSSISIRSSRRCRHRAAVLGDDPPHGVRPAAILTTVRRDRRRAGPSRARGGGVAGRGHVGTRIGGMTSDRCSSRTLRCFERSAVAASGRPRRARRQPAGFDDSFHPDPDRVLPHDLHGPLAHLQGSTIIDPLPPPPPRAGIGRHGAGPPGHARAARPAGRQLAGQLAARDAAAGDDGELGGGRVPWRRSLLGRRRGRATGGSNPALCVGDVDPFWLSCRSQGGRVARAATSCVRLRTSSLRNT